jgi:hypothetical protein
MTANNFWEDAEVISSYTDEEAIEDGVIIPVSFGNITRVTNSVIAEFSEGNELDESKFLVFMKEASEELDSMMKEKQDWFYETVIDNKRYFIAENGAGFTLMKPEDY